METIATIINNINTTLPSLITSATLSSNLSNITTNTLLVSGSTRLTGNATCSSNLNVVGNLNCATLKQTEHFQQLQLFKQYIQLQQAQEVLSLFHPV